MAFQEYIGRVTETVSVTPKILLLRLRLEQPAELHFRAGQFIQIIIGPRILRQYSIVSPPSETRELELCVDVTPGGEGSRYIQGLHIGDPVRFRGPFGVFVVPEGEERPLELVATGAGIAPLASIAEDALAQRPTARIRLLFGNRSEDFLFYHDRFQTLAKRDARFTYIPTLSQPSASWAGERGRVTEVLQRWGDVTNRPFYLCGSPGMVDDTRKVLEAKGVNQKDIHFEKFF